MDIVITKQVGSPIPKTEQWAIRGLRLPAEQAIAKIQADAAIPEEDRAWIVRKIQKSGHAGVIVDGQEHCNSGDTHIHCSVTKLY